MEFEVTLADNGYIVRCADALQVYECREPNARMLGELCCELVNGIEQGTAPKFKVKIEVEPMNEGL